MCHPLEKNSKIDYEDFISPSGYILIPLKGNRMPSARHQLKPKSQRLRNKVQ